MADKSLVMSFMNGSGKKVSITLDNIKEGLTNAEVGAVMDTIIAKNIFHSTGGDLKTKDAAEIVEKNATALTVK